MNTKEVTILFWDNEVNFHDSETQLKLGLADGKSYKYKAVYQFHDEATFNSILSSNVGDDEFMFILVHANKENPSNGADKFDVVIKKNLNISDSRFAWVSRGGGSTTRWYDYDGISQAIEKGKVKPYKKNQLFSDTDDTNDPKIKDIHFDYAIITALYENEFEAVEELFELQEEIPSETYPYKVLKLKNSNKKAIACFATKTGMVEASIIATEMINKFTPKYILMPGVCGGSESTKFGSVIVAEKVFLFQKGKVSDLKEKTTTGEQLIKLQYGGKDFDKTQVTDFNGNKVEFIVEKFESEIENIDIDTNLVAKLEPKLKEIEKEINRPYSKNEKIKVQLKPMACSIMVINKEDYFNKNILTKDRDTKAVEMESYGVARAAKIANGGKTKWLIFKSVMDKTKLKDDDYKSKAAYTSAQFLKHLLEMDII